MVGNIGIEARCAEGLFRDFGLSRFCLWVPIEVLVAEESFQY